jgi:hypothetical protein
MNPEEMSDAMKPIAEALGGIDCTLAEMNELSNLIYRQRERVATACLAGLLANPTTAPYTVAARKLAKVSLECADALIAALDKADDEPKPAATKAKKKK